RGRRDPAGGPARDDHPAAGRDPQRAARQRPHVRAPAGDRSARAPPRFPRDRRPARGRAHAPAGRARRRDPRASRAQRGAHGRGARPLARLHGGRGALPRARRVRLSTSTGRGGRFVPVLAPVKRLGIVLGALALAASSAAAQDASRRVELHFTPTGRAQIALWIESADGTRMATVRLTESVAVRGIGNRPGATQMNSGFRWPYGRREGVLPIWAHRRIEAGGQPFSRVIFDGRTSEGNASTTGGEPRNTRDDYFCLSFNRELSGRDALDAVTCASVFNSNKGRYVTEADVNAGYSEPWEREDGTGMMRPLSRTSIYPPRRDHTACTTPGCGDSADARTYNADAR